MEAKDIAIEKALGFKLPPSYSIGFVVNRNEIEQVFTAGIREVVEFLTEHILAEYWLDTEDRYLGRIEFSLTGGEWQTILKEAKDEPKED